MIILKLEGVQKIDCFLSLIARFFIKNVRKFLYPNQHSRQVQWQILSIALEMYMVISDILQQLTLKKENYLITEIG